MGEREEKGEDLREEKALKGKGGKGSQQGEGGKILGRKRGKIRGRKGLRGERGNGSQQRKGAKISEGKGARGQFQRDTSKKAGL